MSEIGVKLSGDNSEYRSMLADSVDKGAEFGTKLTEKVGDKLFGLREISHTVATALGLNLEKIAEKIASYVTGITKLEEEAYKKSESLQDTIYEKQRQLAEMQLSSANKRIALLADAARYQKTLDETVIDSGKKQLEVDEAKIKLLEVGIELSTLEAEMAKKHDEEQAKVVQSRTDAMEKLGDIEHKTALAKLNDIQKESSLTNEIFALRKFIATAAADEGVQKRLNIELAQRENELADVQAKMRTEHIKDLKEIGKIKFEALPIEEKILTYQQSMLTLQKDIKTGIKEGRDTTESQLALLQNQEEVNKLLIAQAKAKKDAESSVTTEFQRQLQLIQQMTAAKTPGGLRADNSAQTTAAEAALKRAENASQDTVANPNYARDLYMAQLLVDQLHGGGDVSKYNLVNAADAAGFGTQSSNAQVAVLKSLVSETQKQTAATKATNSALGGLIIDLGGNAPHVVPDLAHTPYGDANGPIG